jgi:predicted transposase YbfD/YdcC
MAGSIQKHFGKLHDPRDKAGRRHTLPAMITLAICAIICGSDGWTDIEEFGVAKLGWFKTFLDLPHGVPSHDTFGRVFATIKPEAFERCFNRWVKALVKSGKGRLMAVDGKTLRSSFDRAAGKAAIHMVSAFASANRVVFGQIKTAAKSNEITAIPRLLKLLDLEGTVVTIDAMGCQKAIAREIIGQKGDYVLAVKENQPMLHAQVKTLLDEAIAQKFKGMSGDSYQEVGKGHGRIETRTCWSTGEVHWLKEIGVWPGLRSVAAVDGKRQIGGKTTVERRYFISSLDGEDARTLAESVRGHWGVENPLHWILDVVFREDGSRVRKGHGAENLSRLRRIALNMLQRETSRKRSIRAKRLKAGWDHDYLLTLLQT